MSMKMTMAEFVGLEPCPFCGGEAQMGVNRESTVREYFVGCMNCHIRLYKIGYKRFYTEAEAIAAWNSRAERTCRNLDKHYSIMFKCSECGHWECQDFDGEKILPQTWNYCPNCGAKVVGE